jgi:phosphatidylcholine synthase
VNNKTVSYAVHFYTASGIVFQFLSLIELTRSETDVRLVFYYLFFGVFIDATDGPLARYFNVSEHLPQISGNVIDDIVDYTGFTLIPLALVWRMGWLGGDGMFEVVIISLGMISSLFGFSNVNAKDDRGFFLGFPSYWNIYAFFAGIFYEYWGYYVPCILLVILAVLTLLPVRFIYPNKAPKNVRFHILSGAAIWAVYILYLLPDYPAVKPFELILLLLYPCYYVFVSFRLSRRL